MHCLLVSYTITKSTLKMKRALTGMNGYLKALSAEIPQRTNTYTPIEHDAIINQIRSEFSAAGFRILHDDYRATDNGDVVTGTYAIEYGSDPDLRLLAAFTNSYNKQYRFRFCLGGQEVNSQNSILIEHGSLGVFKRTHKGEADILAVGKIAEFTRDAGAYWDMMIKQKDLMKDIEVQATMLNEIIGALFMDDILNTMQLNLFRREYARPSFDYGDKSMLWHLYNSITFALKESHPADWIGDHHAVHDICVDAAAFYYPTIADEFYPQAKTLELEPEVVTDDDMVLTAAA